MSDQLSDQLSESVYDQLSKLPLNSLIIAHGIYANTYTNGKFFNIPMVLGEPDYPWEIYNKWRALPVGKHVVEALGSTVLIKNCHLLYDSDKDYNFALVALGNDTLDDTSCEELMLEVQLDENYIPENCHYWHLRRYRALVTIAGRPGFRTDGLDEFLATKTSTSPSTHATR